ncbi:MAG: zinc-dependent metalloprotease [Saprospiraceae bacterium]|nr:zinc-dependent metalloprotease [Saprospiraceae bacterium]
MKKLMTFPLLLLVVFCSAQSLKPIAQMVADARQSGLGFNEARLFTLADDDRTVLPVKDAIVLNWEASMAQQLRAYAGAPVSLTLPFENNSTLTLDLVPAKNLSGTFQVHVATQEAAVEGIDAGVHFWGTIQGNPESLVSISVFENEVIGMIATAENQYTIGLLPNSRTQQHVLYKESELPQFGNHECNTDEVLHRIGDTDTPVTSRSGPDNCVRMFIETDYTLFQNKGTVANVVSYVTGVFSQVSALYTNETVNVVLNDIYVWNVVDPYTGPTASNYLTQFRNAKNGVYNGDLAHLVGINNLGGVAYLDVLCNSYYGVGYSSINATYSNVPTYSWTVEVLTHEIGHNLGSSHTHACVWNGNNTAIDGCGPTAGYSEGCTAPLPTGGGTIMSYCHLVSGVGINFNNGFGPQPGDKIRSEVYNAPCLVACGGGGGCTYTAINSNGFDANWGIWTDGGTDCARINNATYANSPTYSIQLRDNTTTSVMTTTNQNYTTYGELTVTFSYITVSFETGEDFWLQVSTNGGSSYTTYGDFNAGTQFTNNNRASGSVVIPGPFTSNTRIRFRADASADDDVVYIDDVVITGCLNNVNGNAPERSKDDGNENALEEAQSGISNLQSGPNPTSDVFNLMFTAAAEMDVDLSISDISGRVVAQQQIRTMAGENQASMQVGHLSKGVYMVQIRAGAETYTQKMILSK